MNAYEHLTEVLTEQFEVSPEAIRPEAGLADLGLDSLMAIELIFALEDRLDIEISVDEVNFDTLGEAAEMLERVLAAKEG